MSYDQKLSKTALSYDQIYSMVGSDISVWFLKPLEGFRTRGEMAESFIGQEMLCYGNPRQKGQLFFWKRKERSASAEVDYLFQKDAEIIPIEVKSGHGSTLQSMRLFLETHPKCPLGIRFSSHDYSLTARLDSRPLYVAATLGIVKK